MASTSEASSKCDSSSRLPPAKRLKLSVLKADDEVHRIIEAGLSEDLSNTGDITTLSTIPDTATSTGYLLAKAKGVLSGAAVFERVFHRVDANTKIAWLKKDGDKVKNGEKLATLSGLSQSLLTAERLALNLMQRMSGIATQTRAMVDEIQSVGSKTQLLDTRKTAASLRVVDKLAVTHGGGANHRMGLFDMVMIKDNHIAASGGITNAVTRAVQYLGDNGLRDSTKIEVETSTLDEVREALTLVGKIDRVMLDNMVKRDAAIGSVDTTLLREALAIIDGKLETEASGNITLDSIAEVAKTGVDFASTGSITHSVTALDISLKFD